MAQQGQTRSAKDRWEETMEQFQSRPMAGRTVLVTGGTGGIGRATAVGLASRVPTSRSPAGTVAAPRTRPARSTPPAADEWTGSSLTCPPSRRCGGWLNRSARAPAADRRAGQQRRRLLAHPASHRGGAGTHLRPQPPRAVPAHQPASGPADARRAGPGGQRRLQRASPRPDRLRQPPGRTRPTPAHGPTTSPSSPTSCSPTNSPGGWWPRRHRQRAPSRRGEHGLRRRGPCAESNDSWSRSCGPS